MTLVVCEQVLHSRWLMLSVVARAEVFKGFLCYIEPLSDTFAVAKAKVTEGVIIRRCMDMYGEACLNLSKGAQMSCQQCKSPITRHKDAAVAITYISQDWLLRHKLSRRVRQKKGRKPK
mmetsp:Transcript_9903/g.17356  ORF Transcript_9903/g.17356 Transcript_9903/m.17356 type:complete len:119 (+) Transcript_9903:139-495(+)